MKKDVFVRYWTNIGGIYSENLASIYNKMILIKDSYEIEVIEDEFTGYFGDEKTREEELIKAKIRWYETLNNVIMSQTIVDLVNESVILIKNKEYLKSIKLREFNFIDGQANISVNIEIFSN